MRATCAAVGLQSWIWFCIFHRQRLNDASFNSIEQLSHDFTAESSENIAPFARRKRAVRGKYFSILSLTYENKYQNKPCGVMQGIPRVYTENKIICMCKI